MINKFNKFKKMNEAKHEQEARDLIDNILDKINNFGFDNLSEIEKEILQKASTEGLESLEDYIDSSDDEKLSFDKHGHILINGVPYTEWSMRGKDEDKDKKKDTSKWTDTSKRVTSDKNMPNYKVRVYKNDDESILNYILIWVDGPQEGTVKKYSTISTEEKPYGIITKSKTWQGKSIEELHETKFDKEYDRFRDLTGDEINLFETFMILRQKYMRNKINDEKSLKNLNNLYKKFSNI